MVGEQERRRIEHVRNHGSFLHCPDRNVLCDFMQNNIRKGKECGRRPCILDDPEYQKLLEIQERNRIKREIKAKQERENEEQSAQIKNQSRLNKTYIDKKMEKIHSLEKQSQEAFRMGKPNNGQILLNKAMIMRWELKEMEGRSKDDRR